MHHRVSRVSSPSSFGTTGTFTGSFADSLTWLLFFGVVLSVYIGLIIAPLPVGMSATNGDEPHYLLLAHSLLHDHDVDLRNNYAQADYRSFYDRPIDPHLFTHDGHSICNHIMIGLPLLIFSPYALLGRMGVMLFLALLMSGGLWALARAATHAFNGQWAKWGVFFFGVSYPVAIYSHQIYPETIGFVIVCVLLLMAFMPVEGRGEVVGQQKGFPRARAVAIGSLLAYLPHLHYKMTILAVLWHAFILWRHWEHRKTFFWWSLPPILLSAGLFLLWIATLFGTLSPHVLTTPIGGTFLGGNSVSAGALGLFFDQEYGLLFYAPAYVLAAVGGWHRLRSRTTRLETIFLIAIYASYHLVGASYQIWHGGLAPVPRYLVPVLPILIIFSVYGIYVLWQRGQWGHLVVLGSITVWLTITIFSHRLLMFGYEQGSNTILREYLHTHTLIQWLPSFTTDSMSSVYAKLALVVIGGGVGAWGVKKDG